MSSRQPLFAVLPIFAAGVLHSLLPVGAFGSHDVAVRALLAGLAAAIVGFPLFGRRKVGKPVDIN
jgi:hypothetical protein